MSHFVDPQTFKHNKTTLSELEKRDLVEFHRGPYSDWGVSVGEEKIIHLTADEESSSSSSGKAKAVDGKFWDADRSSKAYKNNTEDSNKKPLDPEKADDNTSSERGKFILGAAFVFGLLVVGGYAYLQSKREKR